MKGVNEVNDLVWALTSENLVTNSNDFQNFQFLQTDELLQHIGHLRSEPGILIHWLAQQPGGNRLGKYFEKLIYYLLSHDSQYSNVQWGIQIKDGQNTIGELDFVFFNLATGSWNHLEVAVKYYLSYDGEYIGPNAKDTLSKKLDKLKTHQLLLPELSVTKDKLKQLNIADVESSLLLKGFIFYHKKGQFLKDASEPMLSEYCNKGWWLYDYEVATELEGDLYVLPKERWLSKAICTETELISSNQLSNRINEKSLKVPLCLAIMEEINGGWEEVARGFVVAKDWPKN